MPELPPWSEEWLDHPLREIGLDLPERSLRYLLFETGLLEFVLYETPEGMAVLQEAIDLVMTEAVTDEHPNS